MNRLLIQSARIASILALLLGGITVAHNYSINFARAASAPSVRYPSAPELRALNLDYLEPDAQSIVINGQPMRTRRAFWPDTPASLLLALENQTAKASASTASRYFSQTGSGWFVAGRLPDPLKITSRGYMIKAEQQANGTQIWLWDFTRAIDLGNTEASIAGLPKGIQAMAQTQLLFSSQQFKAERQISLAGFSGPGSVDSHARHYQAVLQKAGYKAVQASSHKSAANPLLIYKNADAEVSISISAATDNPGHSIDIVQFRKHK